MKTKLITALILGSFVLAGCGGGGGPSQSSFDAELAARQAAEAEAAAVKMAFEEEAAAAKAAAQIAIAEAAAAATAAAEMTAAEAAAAAEIAAAAATAAAEVTAAEAAAAAEIAAAEALAAAIEEEAAAAKAAAQIAIAEAAAAATAAAEVTAAEAAAAAEIAAAEALAAAIEEEAAAAQISIGEAAAAATAEAAAAIAAAKAEAEVAAAEAIAAATAVIQQQADEDVAAAIAEAQQQADEDLAAAIAAIQQQADEDVAAATAVIQQQADEDLAAATAVIQQQADEDLAAAIAAAQQQATDDSAAAIAAAQQQAAEARRLAAVAQQEAAVAQQEANRAAARAAYEGMRASGSAATLAVVMPLKYGMAADLFPPDAVLAKTTSRTGRWGKTVGTGRNSSESNTVEIYSDVEAPKGVNFKDSTYNSGNSVVNAAGRVIGSVAINDDEHGDLVASGSFPRGSGSGRPEQVNLVDKGLAEDDYRLLRLDEDGMATDDALEKAMITRQQYNRYRLADQGSNVFRDPDDYDMRYNADVGGTLQGASGRFKCASDSLANACTVQNKGASFSFSVNDWTFTPSSGTTNVRVSDAEYMWFGWWAKYKDDGWTFEAKHGGVFPATVADDLTGTATYRGTAAGRYAVHQPAGGTSGAGSFTASARLEANFDSDTVSGQITGFSNDPGWEVTLKRGNISEASGRVGDRNTLGVTWSINGAPRDSGKWEAQFYSNLPGSESMGVCRTGSPALSRRIMVPWPG